MNLALIFDVYSFLETLECAILFNLVFIILMLEVLQVGDIEGDIPSAKRLRLSSSDALQDMVSGEELTLFGSAPNSADSAQVVDLSGNAFPVSVFVLLNLFICGVTGVTVQEDPFPW